MSLFTADDLDSAMVIAVIAMHMMQPAINEVISVIPVRQRFVPTCPAMFMACVMPLTGVVAYIRVGRAHLDAMLVNVVFMNVMQMSIMNVIDVPFMANRRVSATGPMLMRMIRMRVTQDASPSLANPAFCK
jgi:hypothetical protein